MSIFSSLFKIGFKANIVWLFFLASFGFAPLSAEAASFTSPAIKDFRYAGRYVTQSIADPVELKVGETKEVSVTIKNTGSVAWQPQGSNYVSVYTINPKYRASIFYNKQWIAKDHPVKLDRVVKPQETAVFNISLTAPSQPGEYTEYFWLAAEGKTWVKGGGFYFKIKVLDTKDLKKETSSEEDSPAPADNGQKAEALIPTPMFVEVQGNEQQRVVLSFKNVGSKSWGSYLLKEVHTKSSRGGDSSRALSVADASWSSASKIVEGSSVVEPGEILQIEFTLKAPIKKGEYITRFELITNNQSLTGGVLNLPILVTEDGVADSGATTPISSSRTLIDEPLIRVGLYKTDKSVQFQSEFPYQVFSGNDLKGTINSGEIATLNYAAGVYSFKGGDIDFTSSQYIRLMPSDLGHYFTLVNYERTLSGRNKNFNMYRGILEFVYSPKSAAPYVINELPLEHYVAGVAETSNGAPVEYNKALAVAVRSYAYYHRSTRGSQDLFDVYPTTASQLYLGYNSEVLMPKVVEASQSTRGEMVTYNGKPVVTPYFSRSDGRTRSWKEVWKGDLYPWLQSVETIYDKGKTMWGHGVGMSGSDALARASKDAWVYDQILKYYYTGTQVERVY